MTQLKRTPNYGGFGFKYTFWQVENIAKSMGYILERETPTANNGYTQYSLTNNEDGTTALCYNLNEVYQELMSS